MSGIGGGERGVCGPRDGERGRGVVKPESIALSFSLT